MLGEASSTACAQTHLLGLIDYPSAVELQRRLAAELALRDDGQIVLLLCEHPPVVSVGRSGLASEVCRQSQRLQAKGVEIHWVGRGGGPWLHLPGQLAVYPLVPLRWHGWNIGDYLSRLQRGVRAAIEEIGVRLEHQPATSGLCGRTGQLATFQVGVRNWVTHHGAFVNVCPALGLFQLLQEGPQRRISSLVAERGRAVRMTSVRAAVARHLAQAFGCDRYHLHTGHPLLQRTRRVVRIGASCDE